MAAKTYLERYDIETLTLRRLADLAGVSPPTVYAHFEAAKALDQTAHFGMLAGQVAITLHVHRDARVAQGCVELVKPQG